MKKIYILGLLGCMALSSCENFLDKMPSTSLPTEESIKSMNDLQNAVNGIAYLMSQDRMTYSADFAIYADVIGEDFQALSNNNQIGLIARYAINKYSSEPNFAYNYFYKAIANINKALSYIDDVVYTEKEKSEYDNLKGQLYAWRAMLHFDLARYFCAIPTTGVDINKANSGLVLSLETYPDDYVGERKTLKETYDTILGDFKVALPLLTKDKNDGYINYWAALALRSRVNLYYGKYNEAYADAKEVISCDKYKLYEREEYTEVWSKEFTSESLFELRITTNYNAQRNAAGYYCDGDGYGECAFVTDGWLFKYLKDHPEDVRSKMIKDQTKEKPNGKKYANPGYYPAKYPGREGNLYVNSPKIIRLSDVYLIAAEAALYANSPEKSSAYYVNELRKRRIENYSDVASVTLDDILKERRVELFAENSMAFDYWRNKKSVTNFTAGEVKYNDYRTILPIPQDEIDLSGGKLIQNPNY